jgi:hypothetical protein
MDGWKLKWASIFLWVILPSGFFSLSLYGGYPFERMSNTLFLVLYVVLVISLGVLAAGFQNIKLEKLFGTATLSTPRYFFVVLFCLGLVFFSIGFKMFMHGYDYAPGGTHSFLEKITYAAMAGFKFSVQFLIFPVLLGYVPMKIITVARSRNHFV